MQELQEKFNEISKKGYIKGIYNSLSSIGRTFENELNLPMNKECIPDYYGIEIKTRRTYSKSAITLFTAVPNGKESREIERLKNTYGYLYKRDKNYKALYVDVYGNKLTYGGLQYQYKLDINKKEGWNYFKYYKITFFKLQGFSKFLKLLENGIIKISFKIDIYLDKNNYGKHMIMNVNSLFKKKIS